MSKEVMLTTCNFQAFEKRKNFRNLEISLTSSVKHISMILYACYMFKKSVLIEWNDREHCYMYYTACYMNLGLSEVGLGLD